MFLFFISSIRIVAYTIYSLSFVLSGFLKYIHEIIFYQNFVIKGFKHEVI